MDRRKISRFDIQEQLGEGSFSKIYKAIDKVHKKEVALKVEKEDKSKKILKFEYEILKDLQNIPNVPRVYEFVESSSFNFISMELLGKNIANLKKSMGSAFTNALAFDILLQMLTCIENVHSKGYIHRDIKPSNFVICPLQKKVYIVDFGLAKLHFNHKGDPLPERKNTDFRGTIAFASMNAHNRVDLSRRDDLWSFFFVILDLLGVTVPWRMCGEEKEEIERIKNECVNDPDRMLKNTKCSMKQYYEIFYHLKLLKFSDKPDYNLIRNNLRDLLNLEIIKSKLPAESPYLALMQNSFFPQSSQYNLNFADIFQPHICKDSTRISSGNHTPKAYKYENPIKEELNFEDLLNKKRNRAQEDNLSEKNTNSKSFSREQLSPDNCNNQKKFSLFKSQQDKAQKWMAEYVNYMSAYNSIIWKQLELELIQRMRTVYSLLHSSVQTSSSLLSQGNLYAQAAAQLQFQQGIYNNILAFHV